MKKTYCSDVISLSSVRDRLCLFICNLENVQRYLAENHHLLSYSNLLYFSKLSHEFQVRIDQILTANQRPPLVYHLFEDYNKNA